MLLAGAQMALTSSSSSSSPHLCGTSKAGQSQLFGVRSPPLLSARFTCRLPPLPGVSLPVGKAPAHSTRSNFHPIDLADRSLALWSCCWKAAPAASSLPVPGLPSAAADPCAALGGSAALLPDGSAFPAREPEGCGNSNRWVGASQYFFFPQLKFLQQGWRRVLHGLLNAASKYPNTSFPVCFLHSSSLGFL